MDSLTTLARERVRRAMRFGRLGANLLAGSAFISACYRFPKWSKIEENALNDYPLFRAWVNDLSYSMNSKLRISGAPVKGNALYVSNHISWLDTIVLNKIRPLSFIARHDLVEWPLIGTFTQRMECVYIDRTNKFQAYRSIPAIEQKLRSGRSVHLFPESTTSDGFGVLRFYSMFFEAAVRTGLPVQPVAISYRDSRGKKIAEPAFIDDDTFLDTLNRILATDKIYAHVEFLEPLDSTKMTRKELCRVSFEAISNRHKKTST